MFLQVYASVKQINHAPPVPGLPENTDATERTTRTTREIGPPMLSNSYLPAVMQAVAYYVELLQYQIVEMTTVEPPFTLSPDTQTQGSPVVTEPTNRIPISTHRIPTTSPPHTTSASHYATSSHKPGYFAPIITQASIVKPAVAQQKPATGSLPLLSISNTEFFNWFLQMKNKHVSHASGLNSFLNLILDQIKQL